MSWLRRASFYLKQRSPLALRCASPRPPRKFTGGQGRAWSQICRNVTSVQPLFDICSLDRNPIRVALQRGGRFYVAGSKEAFFFCLGTAGCIPKKRGWTRAQRCDRGVRESGQGEASPRPSTQLQKSAFLSGRTVFGNK